MKLITEAKEGMKLADHLGTGLYKSVLLPFWHGVGDCVMFLSVLERLRELYPGIKIDIGLCRGLDQETFIPDAVLLDGDWREKWKDFGYDLVFPVNFPIEKLEDPNTTKAEVCCIEELGIEPTCGHEPLIGKPMCAVSYQMTSVPWVANADAEVAEKVWKEIKDAGYVPIEVHFQHVFHNPSNERFPFVDTHVRNCTPKIETLMALLRACDRFVGVVSGNFHMALSVMGPSRVMLLEKDLKAGHFTKAPIATADIKNFREGSVKEWLMRA